MEQCECKAFIFDLIFDFFDTVFYSLDHRRIQANPSEVHGSYSWPTWFTHSLRLTASADCRLISSTLKRIILRCWLLHFPESKLHIMLVSFMIVISLHRTRSKYASDAPLKKNTEFTRCIFIWRFSLFLFPVSHCSIEDLPAWKEMWLHRSNHWQMKCFHHLPWSLFLSLQFVLSGWFQCRFKLCISPHDWDQI